MMSAPHTDQRDRPLSRWPYQVARLLVCATFPLIFVGGLVTTYQAGMAVPDWPSTYGYNLFLYPLSTWWSGPWDLFVEHGHRLFGALVGLLTISLVVLVWRYDSRRWVKWFSVAALGLVVLQGVLGGSRVLLDDITLARIHGCTAPVFFATVTALAVVLSPRWCALGAREGPVFRSAQPAAGATLAVLLIYFQIVLGSQLRHLAPWTRPEAVQAFVWFHVVLAICIWLQTSWLAIAMVRQPGRAAIGRWLPWLLPLLMVSQIGLGTATWIVQYGFPEFLTFLPGATGYVVSAESLAQSVITTAHVAIGSLILAVATQLCVRTLRATWSHGRLRSAATAENALRSLSRWEASS